jgi:hypothetical protein
MDYTSHHSTTGRIRGRLNRKRIGLAAVVAAVVVGGVATVGLASAGTTPTPAHPYIVGPSGSSLNSGETETLQIAGRTFSGTFVPANATDVTVSVSSVNPSGSGHLTVYTTGTSRPSTSTVSFHRGENKTGTTTVALSGQGRINVYTSERTRYTMRLLSYSTPDTVPACASTIYTIAPSTRTLTNVGGSIRTGATDFGNVTLAAGTYDTRVIGGFTGFNNTDTWLPSGVFLTGTLVVVKGDTINADFSNDITAGGVIIPKSDSATLTQDPTLAISTFLVLTSSTEVHVKLFAYASNSGTAGSGQVKANVQSAQFRKVC